MALSDPLQLIVIAGIVIILFLFGPNKIPEIARTIGRARKEFEAASKEFQQITKEIQNPTALLDRLTTEADQSAQAQQPPPPAPTVGAPSQTTPTPVQAAPQPSKPKTGDQILIETAEKLGIVTTGKTRAQISEEITSKAKGTS